MGGQITLSNAKVNHATLKWGQTHVLLLLYYKMLELNKKILVDRLAITKPFNTDLSSS